MNPTSNCGGDGSKVRNNWDTTRALMEADVRAVSKQATGAPTLCMVREFNRDGDSDRCSQSLPCPKHGMRGPNV